MNNKHSKNSRTLSMYVRLCAGKRINKAEEANRFGVDERSIQRDIDDIRAFLEDQKAESTAESREIVYDRRIIWKQEIKEMRRNNLSSG